MKDEVIYDLKILYYTFAGSKNHGCEAIVRASNKILIKYTNCRQFLSSPSKTEDMEYDLDDLIEIIDENNGGNYNKILYILAALQIRLFKCRSLSERLPFLKLFDVVDKDYLSLSIGGDNYCYSSFEESAILNSEINKRKSKTVLWGCSIEPKLITDEMVKDLSKYCLITARESITYEALVKRGINKNTKLYPDPAFQLDKVESPLPDKFIEGNTIGINISPLIMKYERSKGNIFTNYCRLVQHIIDTTNFQIALIPHVVMKYTNDLDVLEKLYEAFKFTERVVLIKDCNCMELKGYISRCRMFIGARTHATIAAYSTCVPTLVIGYSVKALGIAKDIFGTYENYVISVQDIIKEDELVKAFEWLKKNENEIRSYLRKFMPSYLDKALEAGREIENVLKGL